ncbi:MAG: glycoside hydrolase family 52 protein [Planctomycetota bacterium]
MTIFFNAFHAPIGAHSSFTLGALGAAGGLGLELGGPARENVYIGVEDRRGGNYQALPFYAGGEDEAARYDHARAGGTASRVRPFKRSAIKRDFNAGSDTWRAGDLSFTVYAPVMPVPDPQLATRRDLAFALCPAVVAELTIDNRSGKRAREAFFGYAGANRPDAMRELDNVPASRLIGIAHGRSTAIASDSAGVRSAQGFSIDSIFAQREPLNDHFGLGGTGLLRFNVPAGKRKTVRFAICFHRGGFVTSGIDASYYYFRFFKDIESVARYALQNHDAYVKLARATDKQFASDALSADQRFQLIHAVRSYYGSTQLLDWNTKPFWVVNEGEYRMMNTFDLTVDQLFYEMRMNPWTVRNELDMFTDRYRYTDQLHFPGGANEHPGGISFTHDMGMGNHVSRPGYSTYERFGLTGCFSHMTHEQLVNWVLCAAVYVHRTGDRDWLDDKLLRFRQCLRSMERRDHPRATERNGVMGLDSSRTLDGSEITTYDSLDASLGQARNNVYMAVKCWAAYLAMERVFTETGCGREASRARLQAERCAATICGHVTADGSIPAIMGEDNDSRIIPAIEGLVFPWVLGMREAVSERGRYGLLIKALKRHLAAVLRKGVCLYPDGAWKLSSTADNSWLSKIYLCQFVARQILGWEQNAAMRRADKAHVKWLLNEPNLVFAWSDQMTSGVAKGSKYYPRGVTAILWLDE